MKDFPLKCCPNCGYHKRKLWKELDEGEILLVGKLPLNAEFSVKERERHEFCEKCWYEFLPNDLNNMGDPV